MPKLLCAEITHCGECPYSSDNLECIASRAKRCPEDMSIPSWCPLQELTDRVWDVLSANNITVLEPGALEVY